jgi:hypothetical protein
MAKEAVEAAKEVTPSVEGKLIDMLDALQNGAVKVGETVVKYSPDVADAALWVVRIDGIQSLITGLIFLIVIFPLWSWQKRLWQWGSKIGWDSDDAQMGFAFGSAPLVAGIVISAVVVKKTLLNAWVWIAVFEPKLWLAKQIIDAVVK